MNATSQIKNTVKICADSKRFDSPADSETGSAVKFRQFDSVQFGVVFRTNGALADLSNAAYAELEISDIGALNSPEPRTASVLVRKRVSDLETSLDESAVVAGNCHATFELDKSDTKIDAGEKWLRIYAVDSDGSRTSFANGWIFVEPTYGDDSNLATPDDLKYIVSARDYAEVSEGYANGGSAGLAESSPYYKNNAKYFSEQSKAYSELSSKYATQAQSSFFGASASEESANGYAASATRSASAAESSATSAAASATSAQAAKSAAESAKTAAQQSAASAAASDAGQLALRKFDNGMLYFTGGAATATPDLSGDTLSILFKTDFDFSVAQTADVLYPFLIGVRGTGVYLAPRFGSGNRFRVNAGASVFGSFAKADIAALATGEVNALAFVFKKLEDGNAQVSLFVNGTAIPNLASTSAAFPTISNNLSINRWSSAANTSAGTVGYSDFRIFNFDVSAEDAQYSLADYQKGKRLPPSLSGGVYGKSNPDVGTEITPAVGNFGQTTQGTLAKSDSGYTLTCTQQATRRFWFKLDKKYPAGTWIRVRRGALSWEGSADDSTRVSQGSVCVGTSTTSTTTATSGLATVETVDAVFQLPVEADMIGFVVWNGADVPTVEISIPYIEIRVLGATTALENYTFDGKIRDASGNESHATISGSVAGDMDNSVNQIYSAFSAKYTQENA